MERENRKKEQAAFFLTGCLIGILCFVATYGFKILSFTYDGWLLKGDLDLMQHYIGWGHYRNSPWTFPVGLISTLSMPYKMSVIYTDSVPAVALLFKILSPLLPETFQYFGLYGCFCFAMQGGFSMVLLHRFIEKRWVVVLASFFFVLSFPVLQRMYYHTALASQWVILLSLCAWFCCENDSSIRRCVRWGLIGALCVSIHSYFLPMSGGILLFSVLERILKKKNANEPVKSEVIAGLLQILSFCAAGLLTLWIFGAFYGGASAIGGGIGTFESNLNTFYNPLGHGITGLSFPLYYDFQYEGFGYLGLGGLFLVLVLAGAVIRNRLKNKESAGIRTYLKDHPRQVLIFLLALLFVMLSTLPNLTFNDVRLIAIPLPGRIRDFADIFRSNGRMIWVADYLILLALFVCVDRMMKKQQLFLMIFAFFLQILDLSGEIRQKQAYFNTEQVYTSVFEDPAVLPVIALKQEFILMDEDTALMMDAAYFAMKHRMWTSRFYYARNIDAKVEEQKEKYRQELLDGNAREDAVYLFDKDGIGSGEYPELIRYEMGDHVLCVRKK